MGGATIGSGGTNPPLSKSGGYMGVQIAAQGVRVWVLSCSFS